MAWTYILRCCDGSYYVGSTTDLERRLAQHQHGEGASYTRLRRPVELVWCQEFARVDEASHSRSRCRTGAGRSAKL
ncbi:GIY-YIG nuclease family protein [Luteipulveratus mongoliensis]|uniref:GIY-YIG nuclease family protein n=1 Tax=Luteipulveratus mongoliensis TaxID=571913 RepID=UPI001FDFD2E1|nr:GIY-YIG nuclease family protein [Luteipulveratus mongoliensis]